jgi:hypothetical protein
MHPTVIPTALFVDLSFDRRPVRRKVTRQRSDLMPDIAVVFFAPTTSARPSAHSIVPWSAGCPPPSG